MAVSVWCAPTATGAPSVERNSPEKVRVLDVPYVPQSGALCGGAALAMVLRYWGKTGVLAEDFAALAGPGGAGIRTDSLVKAVEAAGWTAHPLAETPADIEDHLAQGRPVIALIQTGPGSYHYVVLLAWANGWVILHDPNVGPFRAMREGDFNTAWSKSGSWALLVLPPHKPKQRDAQVPAATTPRSPAAPERCDGLVEAGILLAQQGDSAEAERNFRAAESLCPASAAPLRERAGLRFRADDWAGACRLAERALAIDPGDDDTWRLLAAGRFLAGDVEGALGAWNQLSEPRTDLMRVDGLTRIRYSAVAGQLHLPPGRLLTPRAFRQARRRLAEMPAQEESRLSLRPESEGIAQVNVTILERPPVFDGPWDVGSAGVRALTDREITIDVASPTGKGELWTAGWRWWKDRPRVSLALAVPAAGGRPGIWRLDGFWERQAYAARASSGSDATPGAEVSREERRRTALSFSDWFSPDIRLETGAALDKWIGRGSYLSLEGSVERRWARDRLSVSAQGAGWVSIEKKLPFEIGGLSVRWSSSGLERCDAWQGSLGITSTTSKAPLALWSGAGTGQGRSPLLRAHPLLDGGILSGSVFGRSFVHGTVERQIWPWELGFVRIGGAIFIDGARAWDSGQVVRIPWQIDGGAGIRLRGLGIQGQLRLDVARGLRDGGSALSVGWQVP